MLEAESFAKVKGGGSMDCFMYDPANPPAPKKVIPLPAEPAIAPRSVLGIEVFGGKLFSGTSLEDAKGVEKLLSGKPEQKVPSSGVASPIEYLLRLKQDIQQLKEDASKTATYSDPLSKMRSLEQVLDPILADERVAPYLPHISPSLAESDPVDALIIRMRATEGAIFQATGKQQRIQPALLEQQVSALEKYVGTPVGASLTKQVAGLQRDVNVLEPTFLVSCSRRINSLLTEVTLLDQHKRTLDVILPTEVQTQIDALNGLNTKHGSAIQEVLKPNSPLTSSNPQHEAAAKILQRLHALAQQQKLASELLNADGASLKTLTENLAANMKLMKANVDNIEQRLKAIPR